MDAARDSGTGELAAVRPTGEFWHYLWAPALFALLAHQLRQDLVFLLGALVSGCVLAAYPLCRRNLRGVRLTRSVPARATAGEPATIRYQVRNQGTRPAVGLEVDDLRGRGLAASTSRLNVECLDPGREVQGSLEVVFARRGNHVLPGAVLSSRFPLGVFRARREPGAGGQVLVRPREGRPTPLLTRRLLEAGAEADRRLSRAAGVDDLFGLREQREGDDPRRIHWRASARAGRTVVAEWRRRAGRDVLLVLGRGPADDPAAFERAVSLAATAWRLLTGARRPASLIADGRRSGAQDRGTAAGFDLLALARASGVARTAVRLRRLASQGGSHHLVLVAGADETDLLALARAVAGRAGSVLRVPVEAGEAARYVEGLA